MLRSTIQDWRSKLRQVFVLLACLGLTAYFVFHCNHGRYGLEVHAKLAEEATLLDFEIQSLRAARDGLKREIALLAQEPPDPDLVEDVARDVLGYVRPRERLYRLNPMN